MLSIQRVRNGGRSTHCSTYLFISTKINVLFTHLDFFLFFSTFSFSVHFLHIQHLASSLLPSPPFCFGSLVQILPVKQSYHPISFDSSSASNLVHSSSPHSASWVRVFNNFTHDLIPVITPHLHQDKHQLAMAIKTLVTGLVAAMAILSMDPVIAQSTSGAGGSSSQPVSSGGPTSSSSPASSGPPASSSPPASSTPPMPTVQPPSSSQPASSAPGSSNPSAPVPTSTSSGSSSSSGSPGQPTSGMPTQPPSSTSSSSPTTVTGPNTTLKGGPAIPTYPSNLPVGFPLGCWLEGSTRRALQDAWFEDDNMTPLMCSQLCGNYTLFGLEYGGQCTCGNNIIPGRAFPVADSSCTIPCAGNSSLSCGGSGAFYIYQQLPPPPPPPSGLFSNVSFTPGGCLAEPPNGARALNAYVLADPSMTPAFCAEICGLSNYLYYGVEYGNECWCDNSITSGAAFVDPSKCNLSCAGDATQSCGGTLTMNLWNGTYSTNMTGSAASQKVLRPGLDGSRLGVNMPLEDRFYRPEPRLMSLVRPVPAPVKDCQGH